MDSTSPLDESASGAAPIGPSRLVLTLLGPVALIFVSRYLNLQLERALIIGTIRSSVQLLFLGYVLLNIIFSLNSVPVVFTYLSVMILIAALEATGRQVRSYKGQYWDSLAACALGGGVVGLYGSVVIFHPHPWWSPAVLIPTSGMIIGNSVSGPAVAVERLLSEVAEKKHEAETRLAFGSSDYESVLGIVKAAIKASLIPNLNQMAIMGLVSIPGMMTGQLLGGTAPHVAAEYQMAILYLIVTTAAVSSFVAVLLAVRHAIFDREHRLTPEKLIKSGKVDIDQALLLAVRQFLQTLYNLFVNGQIVSCFASLCNQSPTAANALVSRVVEKTRKRGVKTGASDLQQYSKLSSYSDVDDNDVEARNGSVQLLERNGASRDIAKGTDGEQDTNRTEDEDSDEEEDGIAGRVACRIASNVPIYFPQHPDQLTGSQTVPSLPRVKVSSVADHAFVRLHNVNVLSGEGKLFPTGQGLSLTLRRGERLTLEGPSGIGKTRLLRALAELDPVYRGRASFLGQSTKKLCGFHTDAIGWLCIHIHVLAMIHCLICQFDTEIIPVPTWRTHVIYVPQALPPMAGTPLDLVKECLQFQSRANTLGAQVILKG